MFRKCLPLFLVLVMIFTLSACAPAEGPVSPTVEEEGEGGIIPDPDLEAAIRDALDKPTGEIHPSDLEQLTTLRAQKEVELSLDARDIIKEGITDLTGLEYCINLDYLTLNDNKLTDISQLASLTNLEQLEIENNQLSDISPLASLTKLTWLRIGRNEISDISPLASLTNLETLALDQNQITDISPLASLTKLIKLWLYKNQISDISPLAGLTEIYQFHLHNNNISDISPLIEYSEFAPGGPMNYITLMGNPLSETSVEVYIPQLQDRGVSIRR